MSLAIAILVTTASFSFTGDNTEFCYTEVTLSTTAVTQTHKNFSMRLILALQAFQKPPLIVP